MIGGVTRHMFSHLSGGVPRHILYHLCAPPPPHLHVNRPYLRPLHSQYLIAFLADMNKSKNYPGCKVWLAYLKQYYFFPKSKGGRVVLCLNV